MKPFDKRSNSSNACAEAVMTTVPAVMSAFRAEMRARRPAELSVPQFRTLIFLQRHPDTTVSEVAEHLGLALSTTSKLIDGLVKRAYITRVTSTEDRRRAHLALTAHGESALEETRAEARARMAERLSSLTTEEQEAITVAMRALYRVFRGQEEKE